MKTNDIFNFRRFGKYFMSDLRACIANVGLSALLIGMAGIMVYVVTIAFGLILNQTWEGPDLSTRAPAFFLAMAIVIMTMPAKTYGFITEKRAGSSWLMVPASRMEKVVSMLAITTIIIPLFTAASFLITDAAICALDKTCGNSIVSQAIDLRQAITASVSNEIIIGGTTIIGEGSAPDEFTRQITCPWLYVDDIIGLVLFFVLGAVVFKSGKPGKTLLALMGITMAVSMIAMPLLQTLTKEMISLIESNPEEIFNIWIFRHIALFDTVSDTLVNTALILGIWFRIKTLKH